MGKYMLFTSTHLYLCSNIDICVSYADIFYIPKLLSSQDYKTHFILSRQGLLIELLKVGAVPFICGHPV